MKKKLTSAIQAVDVTDKTEMNQLKKQTNSKNVSRFFKSKTFLS